MLSRTKAQSILEYIAIAMLLMTALIVMGPFLKNSVNAHFKILDESIQDSASEPLSGKEVEEPEDPNTAPIVRNPG